MFILGSWKARSIFPSSVTSIELFSLGVTDDAQRENSCSKSAISLQLETVDTKFQVEGVARSKNPSSQKN